jgi:multimeric flavodoxin WrbA
MKVCLINGSPKTGLSASSRIAQALVKNLENPSDCQSLNAKSENESEITQALSGAKAIVLVFPLYVDSLPSHLIKFLAKISPTLASLAPNCRIYAVVNNGFWEAQSNDTAISILKNFCRKSGLNWGQALGCGGGGMIEMTPIGRWPLKRLALALKELAASINDLTSGDTLYVRPSIPRFLYKIGAHWKWRTLASKNNLDSKDLYRRL